MLEMVQALMQRMGVSLAAEAVTEGQGKFSNMGYARFTLLMNV